MTIGNFFKVDWQLKSLLKQRLVREKHYTILLILQTPSIFQFRSDFIAS